MAKLEGKFYNPFKFAPLRLEVNKENLEVWFRLYASDALNLRELLDPGSQVVIRGRVRCYQRTGGYRPGTADPEADRNDEDAFVRLQDAFTIDVGDLALVTKEEIGDYGSRIVLAGGADKFGEAGVRETLFEALEFLRAGLDSELEGIEKYHEAETRLSHVLGDPIWNRPE